MGIKKLCLRFLFDFALSILAGILLFLPILFLIKNSEYTLFWGALSTQLGFLFLALFRLERIKRNGEPLLPFFEGSFRKAVFWGLATGFVLFILNVLHGGLLEYLTPVDLAENNPWADVQDYSGLAQAGSIFVGGIMAPVIEELFLRGILFGALAGAGYFYTGAIYSLLLFVLLHFDPINSIAYAILGTGFLWVYHRTRHLMAPITAHAVNNLLGFFFMLLPY